MRKGKLEGTNRRTYQETHPWITFGANLASVPSAVWMLFGEARSKCQHIAGVPLQPEAAAKLYTVYLTKGVHATTSIEGNTLSEEQVRKRIEKSLRLPASQEYLGKEVDNVLDACDQIARTLSEKPGLKLSAELICEFNGLVLRGLEVEDHVRPGECGTESVGVAGYRGAPWEDCPHLMDKLCEWLNTGFDSDSADWKFPLAVAKSVLAHLYIAWIHPFGDGNGRTARLIEFLLLVQSGVPWPAAHLLSNHYNKTRSRYYAELDRSSKALDGVISFLSYAIRGFVDGLAEQLEYIREQQLRVIWENYVHAAFRDKDTPAHKRRKHLVLDMPESVVPRKMLGRVSPRVAAEYARKGEKTLTRDISILIQAEMIVAVAGGFKSNMDLILAFLSLRFDDSSARV